MKPPFAAAPLFAFASIALLGMTGCGAALQTEPRLSWQGPADTTMTVTWRSEQDHGEVEFGTDAQLGQRAEATTRPYEGSFLHVAELTGLAPETRYTYRVSYPETPSAPSSFVTGPERSSRTPFRFIAFGDSRDGREQRTQLAQLIAARDPAFVLNTGDLIDDGNDQAQWDEWFEDMAGLLSRVPFFAVAGNHEKNSARYFDQFAFPRHAPSSSGWADEGYYSFDYGNTHVVGLSTEPVGGRDSDQYRWLEEDLTRAKADPNTRWIIVFAHRPPYSTGNHGPNLEVQQTWLPLFERNGVAVAFWGHEHFYERTKPIRAGQVDEGGVTHVITGGGGAPLHQTGTSDLTAFSSSTNHFVEVQVGDTELRLDARGLDGEGFDTVTLTKP